MYDTKLVHYLNMVAESIEWVEKEKKVYNVDSNDVESLKFLRLNQIEKSTMEWEMLMLQIS